MSDPNNYTIGWISAIEIEYAAAQEFLDDEHDGPKWVHHNDENHYTLGRIGNHNVVIAVLPRGDNGVAAAAMAAKDMMHTFPNVRVCLMVGIGGGVPSKRHDIRLGDVVVSVPTFSEKSGNQGGVIQYDYGRTIQKRCFQGARYLNRPPRALLTAVTGLSTKYKRRGNGISATINNILQRNQRLQKEYGRPDPASDKLYSSDPVQRLDDGENLASKLIERPERSAKEDNPAIHYGLIASADGFMEDAQIRDILAEEFDVLCFEMEAAGLMNSFPCLVIRGICDYSDKHWFKEWRGHAAMTAAAYAYALLEMLPASDVDKMQSIKDLLPPDIMERAKNLIAPLWGDRKNEAVSVSVTADSEKTQATDTSGDRGYPMLTDQPVVIQSSSTGGTSPEESQTTDGSKDQSHWMLQSQPKKSQPAKTHVTNGQTEIKHVYIAVMGVTGAGKSSLISLCTGKNVKIGHNLESCTADVEDVEFMFNDRVCVHLIDTPGFDDTSRSDVEVLQNIAVWLSDSFEHGTKLSGIIYLHRITDVRMAGSALRNLLMFKKLCGENAYSSVVLATSMWSLVDKALGEQREQELIETKKFWGHMREKGSRIFRLDSTRESCLKIIKYIISLGSTTVLELQDEIVNKGREIEDTGAGVQLNEDIIRERKKHQAELLGLKEQMQEMVETAEHDAELQRALKEEYEELKENIRRNDEEQAKLKQDLKDVHERKDREFRELREKMEADRKKYEDDMRDYKKDIKDLQERKDREFRELQEMMEADRKMYQDKMKNQQEALERQDKEHKAWVNNADTPLHVAASDGKAYMAKSLIDEGANIGAKNKDGLTPLHYASRNGYLDVARLLLDRGADIEARDSDGDTPLLITAWYGKANVATLLLDRGVNIEAKDNHGDTPLHIATYEGNADMTTLLLDRGVNIEAKDNHGNTALHIATYEGNADMTKLLLDKGANIGAQNTCNGGLTPLHYASGSGDPDIARLLIDRGADIEARVYNGSTPLFIATWFGKANVATLLLDRGVNIEARDIDGNTPLHIATYEGNVDMTKLLLDKGANIGAENNEGLTPLSHAISNGEADVAKLLIDRGARG